ncbi:DNA (cytosine-5-)-methyltransferase [Streptomyces albiflaviniger]|nr:DNA (cytosine-5-)-methyltransferase [Streptomyces albiflaviniger]
MTGQGPRIGSLCSGYGGLDMGVQSVLGGSVVWHCEIDPNASAILAQHWPDVPDLGDLSTVDFHEVEPVEVLTAGFPCQDVSLAGLRAGIAEGTRSGLWLHVARAISSLRPSLVVIENVRGLLSAQAHSELEPCPWCVGDGRREPALRALGAVLGDLARIGYDATWACVRASEVGAPHQRERVFILAWPANAEGAGQQGARVRGRLASGGRAAADADDHRGERPGADRRQPVRHLAVAGPAAEDTDIEPRGERRESASGQTACRRARTEPRGRGRAPAADAAGERRAEGFAEPEARRRQPDPGEHRGTDAADAEVERLGDSGTASGRGVQPAPVRGGAAAAADAERERSRVELRDGGGASSSGSSGLPLECDDIDWGVYGPAIARWEELTRPAPRPTDDRGRLSPAFVEWLMGLPQHHVTGVPGLSRAAQLKALGNGVVWQQAAAALRLLLDRLDDVRQAA